MEKIKKYYPQMDMMKGIAMLLMVMGHVIPWTLGEPTFLHRSICAVTQNEAWNSILYKLIYSFHMPLLFFVSGFLFYKAFDNSKEYMKRLVGKRTARLLVPYITTGTLLYLARGHWGYWFLQDLFVLNILVGMLLVITRRLNAISELAIYVVVYGLLIAFYRLTPSLTKDTYGIVVFSNLYFYFPAFMLGLLSKKYSHVYEFIQKGYILLFSFIGYILLFVFKEVDVPYIGFFASLFMPLAMIIFINSFCIQFPKKHSGGVMLIGRYSLEIYILHVFFVMVFPAVGQYMLSIDNWMSVFTFQLLYSFCLSLIAIVCSMLAAKFVKTSTLLKRLLFGQ